MSGNGQAAAELDEVMRSKALRRIELELPATVALDEPRTDQRTDPAGACSTDVEGAQQSLMTRAL